MEVSVNLYKKIIISIIILILAIFIASIGPDFHHTHLISDGASRSRGLSPFPIFSVIFIYIFYRITWSSKQNIQVVQESIILLALFQVFLVFNADVSSTHILNPDWSGHAKFHDAWLVSLIIILQICAIFYGLILKKNKNISTDRIIFSYILGASCPFSVIFPAVLMPLYQGSFNISGMAPDPKVFGIDIVLLFFIILLMTWTALLVTVIKKIINT